MFEEAHDVDVVHQHDPDDGCQPGETPGMRHAPLEQRQQQVGDERHPYLYLDGIGTLAIEIAQGEIRLELFEELLYGPALLVYGHDVLIRHLQVVGEQADEPVFLLVHIGHDNALCAL